MVIHTSGTRKQSVARATLKAGKGVVRVNSLRLDRYEPVLARQKILEPLMIAGPAAQKVNIDVTVAGGGVTGQADAIRVAIARALVAHDKSLVQSFLDYDRQLLVPDVRRKEPRKPNRRGKARSKRQKSYR